MKLIPALSLILAVQISSPVSSAIAADLTFKEKMNLIALLEGPALTIDALNFLGFIPDNQSFSLSGNFSDSGFASNTRGFVNGDIFDLNYTGSLSGDLGSEISISLSSNGVLGTETITSSGSMTWFFDQTTNDYSTFQYQELGEINPFFIPFLVGVASGIVSGLIVTWIVDDGQISTPTPPIIKKVDQRGAIINAACTKDLKGSSVLIRNCNFTDNRNISASVSLVAVPEPTTVFSLLALGTLGAASTLNRKLKSSKSTGKETTKVG